MVSYRDVLYELKTCENRGPIGLRSSVFPSDPSQTSPKTLRKLSETVPNHAQRCRTVPKMSPPRRLWQEILLSFLCRRGTFQNTGDVMSPERSSSIDSGQ